MRGRCRKGGGSGACWGCERQAASASAHAPHPWPLSPKGRGEALLHPPSRADRGLPHLRPHRVDRALDAGALVAGGLEQVGLIAGGGGEVREADADEAERRSRLGFPSQERLGGAEQRVGELRRPPPFPLTVFSLRHGKRLAGALIGPMTCNQS